MLKRNKKENVFIPVEHRSYRRHLNNKLSLVWYSNFSSVFRPPILVQYSNGGLKTGLYLVWYSNGIQITDHLVTDN